MSLRSLTLVLKNNFFKTKGAQYTQVPSNVVNLMVRNYDWLMLQFFLIF